MATQNRIRIAHPYLKIWMETRPYGKPTPYDMEYTELCKGVHEILMEGLDFYFEKFGVVQEDLLNLSVILVAYYEDFLNEVGYWKAFVTFNQEHFGFWLPFYDLTDYDPDYINAEDIKFLIWQWLMLQFEDKRFFAPLSERLADIAETLFSLLEEFIEGSSATDAHEEFLTLPDDIGLFAFRKKVEWLMRDSYLFGRLGLGPEFTRKLAAYANELKAQRLDHEQFKGYLYDRHISLLYGTRCQLGGLYANEWAARIFRCSPELRAKIHAIQPRLYASFYYVREEETHHIFQHPATGREVPVHKGSAEVRAKAGDHYVLPLIQWGTDFWIQGLAIVKHDTKVDITQPPANYIPELLMTPEERQAWLNFPHKTEQKMLEIFGAPYVIFPNAEAAAEAHASITAELYKDQTGHYPEQITRPLLDGLGPDEEIALYTIPGFGPAFCSNSPKIIDYLISGGKYNMATDDVMDTLFTCVDPIVIDWILTHYPTELVRWPDMPFDVIKNAQFLSTHFLPEQSGKQKPNVNWIAGIAE